MTLSSRAIEAGARALSDLTGGGDAKFNHMREVYMRESKACLIAALAAEGMVLMPKDEFDLLTEHAQRAMLSAHQADEDSVGKNG